MKIALFALLCLSLNAQEYTIKVLHVSNNNYLLNVGSYSTKFEALKALSEIEKKYNKNSFQITTEHNSNKECICFNNPKNVKRQHLREALNFYKESTSYHFSDKYMQ